jgi:N-acetylmuramoyl-L-alanine amidase
MKPLLVILDAGHGGIIDGKYVTAPSKMFKHADGSVAMEGVINREIKDTLIDMLSIQGIKWMDVAPGNEDIPMSTRVYEANNILSKFGRTYRCLYVSIHSNAGGGTGFEVFSSPGLTASDRCASLWIEALQKEFPGIAIRTDLSDGDPDKEANFYVLVHTGMPAVLGELLFFDNPKDWKFQSTDAYIRRVSEATLNFLVKVYHSVNW